MTITVPWFGLILDLLASFQDFRAALVFWLENGLLCAIAVLQMCLLGVLLSVPVQKYLGILIGIHNALTAAL